MIVQDTGKNRGISIRLRRYLRLFIKAGTKKLWAVTSFGTMRREPVTDRTTPYHMAHSTVPLGTAFVYGGYDGHPGSSEEYKSLIEAEENGDHEIFDRVKQPVYICRNCYFTGASAYANEKDSLSSEKDLQIQVEKTADGVYLNLNVPDGSKIIFDRDICGTRRSRTVIAGPVCSLQNGKNRILVWKEK